MLSADCWLFRGCVAERRRQCVCVRERQWTGLPGVGFEGLLLLFEELILTRGCSSGLVGFCALGSKHWVSSEKKFFFSPEKLSGVFITSCCGPWRNYSL